MNKAEMYFIKFESQDINIEGINAMFYDSENLECAGLFYRLLFQFILTDEMKMQRKFVDRIVKRHNAQNAYNELIELDLLIEDGDFILCPFGEMKLKQTIEAKEKKAAAGRKGGLSKSSNAKAKPSSAKAVLKHRSSSRSRNRVELEAESEKDSASNEATNISYTNASTSSNLEDSASDAQDEIINGINWSVEIPAIERTIKRKLTSEELKKAKSIHKSEILDFVKSLQS